MKDLVTALLLSIALISCNDSTQEINAFANNYHKINPIMEGSSCPYNMETTSDDCIDNNGNQINVNIFEPLPDSVTDPSESDSPYQFCPAVENCDSLSADEFVKILCSYAINNNYPDYSGLGYAAGCGPRESNYGTCCYLVWLDYFED